ncbi:ionotropic receptor 93a-like [Hetaerina americana]|uniref:ionotropic receptor 93a-like n=1 Tax=Hetaerina americana TaxID=62018 RepID=UPI003A7F3B01
MSVTFLDDENFIFKKGENELIILFTIARCNDTWQLYHQLNKDNILQVSITEPDCPRLPIMEALTIPLMDFEEQISQIILDIRSENVLHWKEAIIIYDDSISSSLIDRIVKVLSKEVSNGDGQVVPSMSTGIFRVDETERDNTIQTQLTQFFKNFKASRKLANFIGFLKPENMAIALQVAQHMGLVHTHNQWLFYLEDLKKNITSYAPLVIEGGNVAFVYSTQRVPESRAPRQNENMHHLAVNWGNYISVKEKGLNEVNNLLLQEAGQLIFALANSLKQLKDTENELYSKVSEEEWEALKPTPKDQRNALLSYLKHPPWNVLYLNDSGSIVDRKGLAFEILDELARNLNFSYTLLYEKTRGNGIYFDAKKQAFPTFSQKPENHSLISEHVVEVVRRKEAVLGAGAFVASARLRALVEATAPLGVERHAFLTSRPQVLSRALIFMAPFASDTWFCIALSILVMGPVLYWVHHLTPYYEFHGLRRKGKITRRRLPGGVKLTVFDKVWKCLWYVYGALLQQGGIQVPMADSGRIVIGTWWLVVIVVMTTYCGNLVAFLTFPTVSSTVSSLEELREALSSGDAVSGEKISLGIVDEAVDGASLKGSADSRLHYLSAVAEVHQLSSAQGVAERRVLARVRRGKHVLIARISHLMLLAQEDYLNIKRCDFRLGGETFLEENLVMIVPKNSPYLKLINEEIKRMHHGGLIQKWTSDSLPQKGLCKDKFHERSSSDSTEDGEEGVKNREVKLDDMQGSFFVLFIGCFLALVTISLEYIWHRKDAIRGKLNFKSIMR